MGLRTVQKFKESLKLRLSRWLKNIEYTENGENASISGVYLEKITPLFSKLSTGSCCKIRFN